MRSYLEFEKSIADIEKKIESLNTFLKEEDSVKIREEIDILKQKSINELGKIYASLTPWQITQVARHPSRPHSADYINELIEDFTPLSGDRYFAEDEAIIGGLGWFDCRSVMIIGHEKGSDTKSRLKHNFGMARPEGYRKASRLMNLANRFNIPVISLIDTAGAYPGIGAEERGQAEAIARSTECCLQLNVPLISVVIGEGGSGGAIALASANKVLMLEYSIYTVASPEASASILWREASKAQEAANTMRITAKDLLEFGVIDKIIPEPIGGAHQDPSKTIKTVGDTLKEILNLYDKMSGKKIKKQRWDKFMQIGDKLN